MVWFDFPAHSFFLGFGGTGERERSASRFGRLLSLSPIFFSLPLLQYDGPDSPWPRESAFLVFSPPQGARGLGGHGRELGRRLFGVPGKGLFSRCRVGSQYEKGRCAGARPHGGFFFSPFPPSSSGRLCIDKTGHFTEGRFFFFFFLPSFLVWLRRSQEVGKGVMAAALAPPRPIRRAGQVFFFFPPSFGKTDIGK